MSQIASSRIQSAFQTQFPQSAKLYDRGRRLFPDGVTHDSRYLEPFPIYVQSAAGAHKQDVDGNTLIDYWAGHGALLLGHSHPAIVEAVQAQVGRATHPGACHELELEWGEAIQRLVPSAERMRFTNSGTEATLMALRIARIVSGKSTVIKFAGHFHGWHDGVIPAADPPYDVVQFTTPGVTDGVLQDLVVVPPNDIDAVAQAIDEHDPACVLHEGNGGHWGAVPVRSPFLRELRQLTADRGVLLMHDEVITGFRVNPGGMQAEADITPDMTTMAKVLAGGLPGGCLAGRADVMDALSFFSQSGLKMKHPGTYNANPLSAAAGIAALREVETGEPTRHANAIAVQLRSGLNGLFQEVGVDWVAYGDYSAVKILPQYSGPASDGDDFIPYGGDYMQLEQRCPADLSHAFRCALLLEGVDWMGWAGSTTVAHSDADVERTVAAFRGAIERLRADGHVD